MTKGKFRPLLFAVVMWMHLMALVAIWYGFTYGFTLSTWIWFWCFYTLRSAGISLGSHRLFTHRSFKTHFPIELLLDFCAGLAAQGPLRKWVLDHDQHHLATETEWDPHSPTKYGGFRGFLWSHIGWLFWEVNRPPGIDLVQISAKKNVHVAKWDKWIHPVAVLSGFVVPLYFEGWGGLLLVGFAGVVVSWHITWSVNSIGHMFGVHDESYHKHDDQSRNNWMMSILNYIGEAWHSYHHEKADCAFLGWKWYQPDLGKWILISGEPFGLFWDIKRPPLVLKTV